MAKQRETVSVEKIYCGHLLFFYETHRKEDIELFIEKANAYHPTHITFFLLVKYEK